MRSIRYVFEIFVQPTRHIVEKERERGAKRRREGGAAGRGPSRGDRRLFICAALNRRSRDWRGIVYFAGARPAGFHPYRQKHGASARARARVRGCFTQYFQRKDPGKTTRTKAEEKKTKCATRADIWIPTTQGPGGREGGRGGRRKDGHHVPRRVRAVVDNDEEAANSGNAA